MNQFTKINTNLIMDSTAIMNEPIKSIRYVMPILLFVCMIFTFAPFARADVISEPSNDFYNRHREECSHIGRSFYANGEGGSISLLKEPGSKSAVMTIDNGDTLYIDFTYNYRGEDWGIASFYDPDKSYNEWPNGWVPMDQLLLVYDYLAFDNDHEEEFYAYKGGYDSLKAADVIYMWSWPGSGETVGTLVYEDSRFMEINTAYKDDAGREWGFIGYWYGNRNFWVCLSDPANDSIDAFNPAPEPALWQPTNPTGDSQNKDMIVPALAIILVSCIVIVTGVLIKIFW